MKTKQLTVILGLFVSFISLSVKAQDLISQKELTENDIQNLEVKGRFCEVDIKAVNGNTLSFKGKITGNLDPDAYRIVSVRVGNTLKITIEGDQRLKSGWNQRLQGSLIFSVPPGINCQVDNSSGSVAVRGLNGGNINLSASSGEVRAESMRSNQEIVVRASSGSLKLNGIEGNLRTNTSSGSQEIDNVKGNVDAGASSGSIDVNTVSGSVAANTSSGAINLNNIKGALTLKASSGSITGNNIDLTDNSNFNTTSGSVSIRFNNPMSDLSFDLSASSGGLKAGGNQGNRRLVVNQGKIRIVGNSSSGSQNYDN
jgi:DUF4097 and DUF4098 domain-containing protein YvlB